MYYACLLIVYCDSVEHLATDPLVRVRTLPRVIYMYVMLC